VPQRGPFTTASHTTLKPTKFRLSGPKEPWIGDRFTRGQHREVRQSHVDAHGRLGLSEWLNLHFDRETGVPGITGALYRERLDPSLEWATEHEGEAADFGQHESAAFQPEANLPVEDAAISTPTLEARKTVAPP
jgi:hypothetical protein